MINVLKKYRRQFVRLFVKGISSPAVLSNADSMIIAPHPDDEVLACGGLIASKKSKGAKVAVVFLTDGKASHKGCCNTAPEKIGLARRRLAIEAGEIIGLKDGDIFWLGLSDGRIPRQGKPDFKMSVERLAKLIEEIKPQEVYAPHYLDGWPDHEAASDIVCSALLMYKANRELYYYPVWLWHNLQFRSFPFFLKTKVLRLDIRSVMDKKKAAIDKYLSLINPDCGAPYCGNLPKGFVKHFQYPYEIFFKAF